MPPRLRLNPEAEADLVEAFAWYEAQRPGLGSEFFAEVAQVLQRIEDAPLQYAVVQEDTRRAIVRRFRTRRSSSWIPTSLPSQPA